MADKPTISEDEVRALAHLARLAVTDDEVASARTYLASILDYAARLRAIDTTGIAPYHPMHLGMGQLRSDEATVFDAIDALATGDRFKGGLLTTKAVFKHKQ